MTDADTIDREPLYVTDDELIQRMNVPKTVALPVILVLDKDPRSGFPQKQKLWGDRRFWPAVKAYFYAANHVNYRHDAARSAAENRVPHSAAASPPLRRVQRRDTA